MKNWLYFGTALTVLISTLALWQSTESHGSRVQKEKYSDSSAPKKSFSTNDLLTDQVNNTSSHDSAMNSLKQAGINMLHRLDALRKHDSIDYRASVFEEAYDLCGGYLSSLAANTTVAPSACLKIKEALEAKLEVTDIEEEKIRLIEILVRWRPPNEQLAFVRDIADSDPVLSASSRFGLEYMTISKESSEDDKVAVLESFSRLPQEAKLNHANNTFDLYRVMRDVDNSQGYVSYEQPLLDAINAFVLPDIPEPFVPSEGMPEITTEEEFETWASQNPADARLLGEALYIDASNSSAEGMYSRINLELSIQGLSKSASDFTTFVESRTSDTELYYTLIEIHQHSLVPGFVDEHIESIRASNIIQTRLSNLRSDPGLSSGQVTAVENLYLVYWPD